MDADLASQRILIVEPRFRGHLLVYVRLVAERALARGAHVTVALGPGAAESREYATHLASILDKVDAVVAPEVLTARAINELARRVRCDLVVVPHGDELAAQLGAPWSPGLAVPTRLLIMRDPRWDEHVGARRALRNLLKLVLLTLASRRPNALVTWLRGPLFTPPRPLEHVVDPFIADEQLEVIHSEAAALRASLTADQSVFWFGVTGAVSRRKNLGIVASGLQALRKRRPELKLGLAVVGPIDADVLPIFEEARRTLSTAGVRVHFDDRLLTNREMNIVVAAVDAVVMAYDTGAPNSTLGKAYVLGTKIVSAGSQTFRTYAQALDGVTARLGSAPLSQAMERAYEQDERVPHPGALSSAAFADGLLRGSSVVGSETA